METKATFAIAEVKAALSDNPNGEFEIIMSTESVDRDGETIVKGAFDPLPDSVPVHAFHDFNDPIGRAVPGYNEAGQLVGRGFFASTARAQEIRQLVTDGVIGHTSVGFMAAERKDGDSATQIVGAELLEVSFVSVPSNRDAAVLLVKSMEGKQSTRNGTKNVKDSDMADDMADDDVFLRAMIAHHEAAIVMAREYLEMSDPATRQPRVADLARGIIAAQTSEISSMRAWLQEKSHSPTDAPVTPEPDGSGKSPASEVSAAEYARLRAEAAQLRY